MNVSNATSYLAMLFSLTGPVRKAIIGGLVTILLVQLAKHGISADMTVNEAVNRIANGLVAGLSVYLTTNKGSTK